MAVTGQSYWPGVGISTVRLWAVFHGDQQALCDRRISAQFSVVIMPPSMQRGSIFIRRLGVVKHRVS